MTTHYICSGSKSEAELLTHSALNQLLQGQTEIKEQLTDLKTLWNEVSNYYTVAIQ